MDDVAAVLSGELAERAGSAASLSPLVLGHGRALKFAVSFADGRRAFAKVYPKPLSSSLRRALDAARALEGRGFPLNRIYDLYDSALLGRGVELSEWLGQETCLSDVLASGQLDALMGDLRAFGRRLREMHAASALTIDVSPAVVRQIELAASAAEVVEGGLSPRLRTAARSSIEYLGRHPREETCLLHGDIHPGNMFLGSDGVTLVDFEACQYGDRLYDLANLLVHLEYLGGPRELFDAVAEGYMDASEGGLGEDAERFGHVKTLAELRMNAFRAFGGIPEWWN